MTLHSEEFTHVQHTQNKQLKNTRAGLGVVTWNAPNTMLCLELYLMLNMHNFLFNDHWASGNWQDELFKAVDPSQIPEYWGGTARAPDALCSDYVSHA